jgi:hypothetical protein
MRANRPLYRKFNALARATQPEKSSDPASHGAGRRVSKTGYHDPKVVR